MDNAVYWETLIKYILKHISPTELVLLLYKKIYIFLRKNRVIKQFEPKMPRDGSNFFGAGLYQFVTK